MHRCRPPTNVAVLLNGRQEAIGEGGDCECKVPGAGKLPKGLAAPAQVSRAVLVHPSGDEAVEVKGYLPWIGDLVRTNSQGPAAF